MADTEKLKQALATYTGDEESLNQFTAVATAELGDNWTDTIFGELTDLTPEEQEKLNHAFQYYAAITAWNEAQTYLTQEAPLDRAMLTERIPILKHWLAFFQESGDEVVAQLQAKLSELPTDDADMITPSSQETTEPLSETTSEENTLSETVQEPVSKPAIATETTTQPEPEKDEKLFLVDKIKKQIEMMQSIQAWVSARCIELGNKEVFHYPHYGLVVDMMKQTRTDIQSLLDSSEELTAAERAYPGEVQRLQDYQLSLDKDIEIAVANGASEETDLIGDDLTAEDVKKALGAIDTSNTPEFSGPAPDGFEPILDSNEELDETPIKEEYNQIENMVMSEQKPNDSEKKTSQTPQNGVKKKLSFSLGNKKPAGT